MLLSLDSPFIMKLIKMPQDKLLNILTKIKIKILALKNTWPSSTSIYIILMKKDPELEN